jgi:DNA (cytosine-5)-methyltransferase 1
MKYVSLCSGIEAASEAWHPLGWAPLAFSEIEPFCCDYLAHHYPDVPNLGSMDDWREWPIELIGKADVLVAGTPCQSFSIAGLRAGLEDDRGNLTLIFVEIANAIDDFRRDNRLNPLWTVWENVPGVYSDNTNGFGSLLAGLCGSGAAIEPPRGRSWTNSGVVSGPQRTAAWRTLDAQYFGVAQRRRRVFVFARGGPGNWAASDALCPIAEGMRGNTPPRRETRQNASDAAGSGIAIGGETSHTLTGEGFDASEDGTGRSVPVVAGTLGANMKSTNLDSHGAYIPMLANTLTARMHNGINTTVDEGQTPIVCTPAAFTQKGTKSWPQDVAPTLNAHYGEKYGLEDQNALSGGGLFVPHNELGVYVPEDVYGIPGNWVGRNPENGGNAVQPMNNLSPNLTATDRHVVAAGHSNGNQGGDVVTSATSVRRLTPRECERLQGFRDDATLIPRANGKMAADGPRYKALGNSMAVPVMRYLGERIEAMLK